MPDVIKAVIETRELAGDILAKSLTGLDKLSELEIKEKLLAEIKKHEQIFPDGWYSPPPSGIAIILNEKPFQRLQYDNLRKPDYWPREDVYFEKESVGMFYFSPIDRQTGMIGDIGFTIYRGASEQIKQHIKNSYNAILKIAKYAEVGMELYKICEFAGNNFKNEFKTTKWTTFSSPNLSMNLGHSVPGSFGNITFGNNYEQIKETIRTNRVHINEAEHFKIPETSAFTIESRLEDLKNPDMPSVYFHFIVCFNNGQKTILENFNQVFTTVGMDYMNSK